MELILTTNFTRTVERFRFQSHTSIFCDIEIIKCTSIFGLHPLFQFSSLLTPLEIFSTYFQRLLRTLLSMPPLQPYTFPHVSHIPCGVLVGPIFVKDFSASATISSLQSFCLRLLPATSIVLRQDPRPFSMIFLADCEKASGILEGEQRGLPCTVVEEDFSTLSTLWDGLCPHS